MYMYRKFYIVTLICFIFTCCSRESTLFTEDVNTTFQATIQPEIVVRGGSAEAPEVIAQRAYMEVWWEDVCVLHQEKSIEAGTTQINFPVRLAGGFEYDVYFWADCGGEELADKYYNTNDLRNVSLKQDRTYDGTTPEFDAFFAYKHVEISQEESVYEVTLKRPFAKVSFSAAAPQVKISFTAPTALCLKTGMVSNLQDFEYTIEGENSSVTAFDYVFADEALSQMSYSFKVGNEEQKTTSVPIARNTKTNIIYNTTTN